MDTTTINGLHSCKPENTPIIGEVKTFVIQQMKSKKTGKPYIKIKNEKQEFGGTPHRILSAEPTGFTDPNGNISFNLEIEEATSAPSAFQKVKSTMTDDGVKHVTQFMQQGEPERDWPEAPETRMEGEYRPTDVVDGVTETRKHLMQSANLYNLCVAAVDKAIAPHMPPIAQTSEMFQAAVASLYIEASKDVWWSGKIVKESYLSKMPTKPIE